MNDNSNNVKDYLKKNGKIILPVSLLVVVAVIFTIVLNVKATKDEKTVSMNTGIVGESMETNDNASATVTEGDAATDVTETQDEGILAANQDEAITALINTYYAGLASGDAEVLNQTCDEILEADMLRIIETSQYIENYPVIDIYTKSGPEEGSTIAYVYYKVSFVNHEEQFPGYTTHYICTDSNGQRYIKKSDNPDSVNEFIQTASTQDDVIEFNNRISVEYTELMESHPELLEYLNELNTAVNTAVGEKLAEKEATENDTDPSVVQEQDTEQVENNTDNSVQYASATTTVNVRASDSENADKIGQVTQGTSLQVVEQLVNGWTKVVFDGKEGFIKSEFLQVSTVQLPDASGETVIGTAKATTSINVRASASETAERITVVPGGETVEVYSNENGWSKIRYNDKIGYVKTEFLQ